jgi:hypothetical protein
VERGREFLSQSLCVTITVIQHLLKLADLQSIKGTSFNKS